MSADEMEFDTQTEEIMENDDNDEHQEEEAEVESTLTQQALKQLNQLTSSNGTSASKVVTAISAVASTSTSLSTAKLPQKPETKLNNAQILYIKNANGTQTPVHIPSGSQTGNPNKHVQLVQLPKSVVPAGAPNSTRILLKGAQKFILASSGGKATTNTITAAGTSVATPRSISVSQAQQIGLLSGVSKTVSTASGSTAAASTATKTILLKTSAGALKNPPTILNKGVKPIQSSSIVTLAGTNQQVRKMTVPGKGVQLVRVVNALPSNSSGTTTTTTTTKVVNGRQQQVIVQHKLPLKLHTSTPIAGSSKSQYITKKLGALFFLQTFFFF